MLSAIAVWLGVWFVDGVGFDKAAVHTAPFPFAVGCFAAIFLTAWPRPVLPTVPGQHPRLARRTVALLIDLLHLDLLARLCLVGLGLGVEALATGQWQWSWTRDTLQARDFVAPIGTMAVMAFILFRTVRALRQGRQTAGQYVMGFRVVPSGTGKPNYAKRIGIGLLGYGLWPLTLLLALRQRERNEGIYDWDDVSNTRAVSTRPR